MITAIIVRLLSEQATTYNYDGGHIKIDYHIKLNKDNPQESIDRIKKLAVLK